MVQLTPEQRTFVITMFYETNSLQQARVAFGLEPFESKYFWLMAVGDRSLALAFILTSRK
jgi:hypothetical protein